MNPLRQTGIKNLGTHFRSTYHHHRTQSTDSQFDGGERYLADICIQTENGEIQLKTRHVTDRTFREHLEIIFTKDHKSSLLIRCFNILLKFITCVLYIYRAANDTPPFKSSCFLRDNAHSFKNRTTFLNDTSTIDWTAIVCVDRSFLIWLMQVILASISLFETLLMIYLQQKGQRLTHVLTKYMFVELIATIPWLTTLAYKPFRALFIPVFFNAWLMKRNLEGLLNDLNQIQDFSRSILVQQLSSLAMTVFSLLFTAMCGFQQLQRGGHFYGVFDTFYYVIISTSTVGYGDIVPDIWPSKLFMTIMIVAALILIPTQLEQMASFWFERQKYGGTYNRHRAAHDKHVVVCTTSLNHDQIMDFLNEFYSHRLHQTYHVILISPAEPDVQLRSILLTALWKQRVIYMQGSALRTYDLIRARVDRSRAVFILETRTHTNKIMADQHSILRSWAVKDFAPYVPQYVQIFRPENKIHVKFAGE
ncbi:unnamed protein product [Didymodactylos carnosus]|uniref:RCK N-terminal domain-containing protein n=2 Tax=Didymodactylos carnosus TaxID=1234261 RepID=A0A813NXE0_9BILA|nr:unnamed protein product [Didymodactylos carnosus]CAF3518534.1 unnamed protein product [Didymodactylos carnosus]